ncbi:hypothetical protein EDEG_03920 [Edhazardia aedis USNM 41457]|uniref:Uncharacterized protein n=1 Tax=Edhazardia aedis (strain USNM 41457) TaxID=1003232 RepID=J8ZP65_EDHAE|nr:hypothetical protein EDEG_03920 [Edhazardia aedis USNM 41457]|eukprot:EJW01503.1 hypothetical protein EDEG_03920 [Edhazardia aedis USNM 41457]
MFQTKSDEFFKTNCQLAWCLQKIIAKEKSDYKLKFLIKEIDNASKEKESIDAINIIFSVFDYANKAMKCLLDNIVPNKDSERAELLDLCKTPIQHIFELIETLKTKYDIHDVELQKIKEKYEDIFLRNDVEEFGGNYKQ